MTRTYTAEELRERKVFGETGNRIIPKAAPIVEEKKPVEIKPEPKEAEDKSDEKIIKAVETVADALLASTKETARNNEILLKIVEQEPEEKEEPEKPQVKAWDVKITKRGQGGLIERLRLTPIYEGKNNE